MSSTPTSIAESNVAMPGAAAGHAGYREVAAGWRNRLKSCGCHAADHWCAESFRGTAGEAMTVRRAKALNAVLAACPLHVVPGELLAGIGNPGRFLPAGALAESVLAEDRKFLYGGADAIGRRWFGTHADHHAPDYAKLLRLGFGGLKNAVLDALPRQDAKGRTFLESMLISLEGATAHLRRWSKFLTAQATTGETTYGALSERQAGMLARLATEPAASFHEAVQLVLAYHFMMQLDQRYAMAFGRLDQILYPYYRADREAGNISEEEAQAILDHFFAKITVDGDVQNIALGGVKPADGSDATNALSFMLLEACQRVAQAGGNCTARIHRNTPPAFLEKCTEVVRSGIGYPAVFNDEIQIPALVDLGYKLEDARDYCFAGCIEVFIPGKQAPWADDRSNPLYCLNLALFHGVDSLTGKPAGVAHGDAATYEEFYQQFMAQCQRRVGEQLQNSIAMQKAVEDRAEDFTSPLMSTLVDDCIGRGRDVNDRGAVYPANNGFAGMGIGSVADTLAAIRKFVFEEKRFTLAQLRTMSLANFEGYEPQRQLLLRGAPKYGNDNDEVDLLAARFVTDYAAIFAPYRNPQGGFFWLLLGANVSNIPGGAEVGATADGRLARTPLSDAGSPTFGRDKQGPTAVVRSVAKIPYRLCAGGNVINMKLHAESLGGPDALRAMASLIRTCFDLGGIQLQFNTTDRQTLIKAIEKPEEYENLVVRVSGFSAYYTTLGRAVQDDILARTEHSLGGS